MQNTDSASKIAPGKALRSVGGILWAEADGYVRRRMLFAGVLVVASAALGATAPVLYKELIDLFAAPAPRASMTAAMLLVAAYSFSQYLQRAIGEVRSLVQDAGTQRLNTRLSQRLFGHIVRLPLRYHLERKSGAVGETLNQGLSGCQILLQHFAFTFLPVLAEFSVIVGVLIHFGHAVYLTIFAVSAMAYGVVFWRGAARIAAPTRASTHAYIETHATLTDTLLNYETVKYFGGEAAVCERYRAALAGKESAMRAMLAARTRNSMVISVIHGMSLGLCLGVAGHEVIDGTMTAGDFVLINAYVLRLMLPLQTIGFAVRDVSQALAYVQRMLEMFDEVREPEIAAFPAPRAPGEGLVFEHVGFRYRTGRTVIDDVSFEVPPGRTVAIVGPSGSGKSSLIRLLFRLYEPDSGRILLDGLPIADMPLEQLRGLIAIVPQDTVLFNDTLGANIGFARAGATRQEIENAARMASLHEFIARLPEGYETRVGERGLKLSGGEKQRVAIARAALRKPRIFVFDEATSSLDSATEREILRNLAAVAGSATTLVIAHRLSTIAHADQIVVLDRGSVVERGTHTQLLAHSGQYAALWHTQQDRLQPAQEFAK